MMKNGSVDSFMGNYGIVLVPNKRLKVIFDQPFHLKMAVLDFNGFVKQEAHFRVMLIDNNDDQAVPITLCILNKQTCIQIPLDLKFEIGDDVSFFVRTECNMNSHSFTVHLSGVTSKNPDDVLSRPLISLSPKKTSDLIKPRSTSLPEEHFQPKRQLPAPLMKIPPDTGTRSCLSTPTTTSPPPTPLKMSARSAENIPLNPPNSPSTKKSSNWARSSFKAGGDLVGRLGKLIKP
ncbi:Peptidyl-prolyl cis-trans isomerase [Nesidiocoris tenuis]|uniref:Peptidyl-prolyl cis-trans isomerase n=1 Tax=Nesidiocoris tenuis TaxID=355587 RepID=A0ABN7AKH8_9HEMI|nr:Peptidyl-prolyl cis-trans isomerase [Nesidiocoris tenuis]